MPVSRMSARSVLPPLTPTMVHATLTRPSRAPSTKARSHGLRWLRSSMHHKVHGCGTWRTGETKTIKGGWGGGQTYVAESHNQSAARFALLNARTCSAHARRSHGFPAAPAAAPPPCGPPPRPRRRA
eukprot:362012-Chlamydomonas_euryale.AAC.5